MERMLAICIKWHYSKLQSNKCAKLIAEEFNHSKLKQAQISETPYFFFPGGTQFKPWPDY